MPKHRRRLRQKQRQPQRLWLHPLNENHAAAAATEDRGTHRFSGFLDS